MSNNHISSTEFATLCQSQITLLTKSLGAVWSIVYLTEEFTEDGKTQLFPFAIYPETDNQSLSNLPAVALPEIWQQSPPHFIAKLLPTKLVNQTNTSQSEWKPESPERKQLILPLIHQETFIGLLVTGRKDREWQKTELEQIEEIARTLAIARFLELQYHWTKEELAIQANLRHIEHDRLDDLLHQLRNPLTALRTFSKLLMKRLLPEDRNRSIVKSLLEQSDRFQELLQQFEAESNNIPVSGSPVSIDTNSLPLLELKDTAHTQSNFLLPSSTSELNPINLKQILEPLLNTAQAIATEREIQLTANIPESIPSVMGNFQGLREVLNNLIDNALKYTPAGGKVHLNLEPERLIKDKKYLGIAIQDTGYGIPPQDREHIFTRHYRGVQAASDIPGTGLGLAIAKELITKMQGEMELISPNNFSQDSNTPGTTLIVWLPVSLSN